MNDPSGAVSFMWLPGVRTTVHPCFSAVRNSFASSFRDPMPDHPLPSFSFSPISCFHRR